MPDAALVIADAADGSVGSEKRALALCDGSEKIVFYVHTGGGSAFPTGESLTFENGTFLVVRGDCTYWVSVAEPTWSVYGMIWTGTLDDANAERLLDVFHLDEFSSFAGSYSDAACDGPGAVYWYAGARVEVNAACFGSSSSQVPQEYSQAYRAVAGELRDSGTLVSGAVRFLLLKEQDSYESLSIDYRGASAWPLPGGPNAVVVDAALYGPYIPPGVSHRVESGAQADALRALRTAWLAGDVGAIQRGHLLPIQQPDGSRYRLFLRDCTDFEDDKGLIQWP